LNARPGRGDEKKPRPGVYSTLAHQDNRAMHAKRHALTVHAAYILAAKLRAAGVTATGRDVLSWPADTLEAARLWLETIAPAAPRQTWAAFMGRDLPPPRRREAPP
jgi:hypothetical protein